MALTYPVLAGSSRVQEAAANKSRPLAFPETSDGVARLQQALLDVGYDLPITIKKIGKPDGIFGDETKRVVTQFQNDSGLTADGMAGPNTLQALNDLAMKGHKPSPPPKPLPKPTPPSPPSPPPPPPPSPTPEKQYVPDPNSLYKIGTVDPHIPIDFGAGAWNSEPATLSMMAKKLAILNIIGPAMIYPGPDAAKHMLHYMNNTGSPINIDYSGLLNSVPSAKEQFTNNKEFAQRFCETLPTDTHEIVSKEVIGVYCTQSVSANWFFAVGGFACWGKGTVRITGTPGARHFKLTFIWNFFDRYNWDGGKAVTIAGITITDKFMATFHRQGLAMEFDMKGRVTEHLEWDGP